MRNALECFYSLFANSDDSKGHSPNYTSLNPVLEYSSFPVLDVKYDPKFPSQVQLVMNPHVDGLREKIDNIRSRLNGALWVYARHKLFEEQRLSVDENRDCKREVLKKWAKVDKYSFSMSSYGRNGRILTVTNEFPECVECVVEQLLKDDLCDAASLPPELKVLIPDELRHLIPREFDTLSM